MLNVIVSACAFFAPARPLDFPSAADNPHIFQVLHTDPASTLLLCTGPVPIYSFTPSSLAESTTDFGK